MRRVLAILFLWAYAQASLCQLSGPLSGVLEAGVYHVTDSVWVNVGDSLRLLPGTTFQFDGPYPFRIYGALVAEGTEADSIVFTTELSGSSRWRGLRFLNAGSSGSRLAYCLIENGYATGVSGNNDCGGGVYCDHSSPIFENCTLTNNHATDGGAIYCTYSSASFTNCSMSGNSVYNDGGGVHCENSSPIFVNCMVSENTGGSGGGAQLS